MCLKNHRPLTIEKIPWESSNFHKINKRNRSGGKKKERKKSHTYQFVTDCLSEFGVCHHQSLSLALSFQKLPKTLGKFTVNKMSCSIKCICCTLKFVKCLQLHHLQKICPKKIPILHSKAAAYQTLLFWLFKTCVQEIHCFWIS